MNRLWRFLTHNTTIRNLGHVSAGNLLAQILALLTVPLLTRLYAPVDYGAATLYTAIVTIGAVAATARYERAIPLIESGVPGDEEVNAVAQLAARVLFISSGLLFVLLTSLVLTGHNPWDDSLGQLALLLPLGVTFAGGFQILNFLAIRDNAFREMGQATGIRAVVAYAVQLALGLIAPTRFSLVAGSTLGDVASTVRLLRMRPRLTTRLNLRQLAPHARKHARFPKFEMPFALANAISWSGVVILLEIFYSTSEVGAYGVAYRVLALPAAVFGAAVGHVYLRKAALLRPQGEAAWALYLRTLRWMLVSSVPLFVLLAVIAPRALPALLGPAWSDVGAYVLALAPVIWARFIGSPLTGVYSVYGHQRMLFLWQLVSLGVTLGTLLTASQLGMAAPTALTLFAVAGVGTYALMGVGSAWIVKSNTP
uniref:oligosaccharide flippase family protein n=1 Tax=Georgenia sp. M64 TaxID=3120520 RepID=UPI0040495281